MAKEVYMPALGMNQETGTLLRWLKQEGDTVTKGEPLMEVATDKTDVEIEASVSGILRNVTAQEGDEIPVGQVIALIAKPGEVIAAAPSVPASSGPASPDTATSIPAPSTPTEPSVSVPPVPPASSAPITPVAARMAADHGIDVNRIQPAGNRIQKEDVLAYLASQPAADGRVLASPKARRLAEESGVDLTTLHGSGPEGAILAADVEASQRVAVTDARAAQALPEAKPDGAEMTHDVTMSRMWKVMADRLTQSWTSVPHFFLARDVDAKRFTKWHRSAQERSQSKLTYTDLLVKLVAQSLAAHARVNAAWVDGRIVGNQSIHIGLAVAVEDGLLVPVIRHADRLGLEEIAQARSDLVARAQAGKLGVDELQGGTFTISNLGMFGIDQFSAIINPPQAAILAVGRIADRVVAVDGKPKVRPMLTLNLSSDHRVVDGARAARFLDHLARLIEDPMRLLD
jgi:pyruvate dehydrogenase E2 component (dihydrolipoamide acetyltransferase)